MFWRKSAATGNRTVILSLLTAEQRDGNTAAVVVVVGIGVSSCSCSSSSSGSGSIKKM